VNESRCGRRDRKSMGRQSVVVALTALILTTAVMPASTVGTKGLSIRGQRDKVYTGLRIASENGNCVSIVNSFNITIEASDIGPCDGHAIYIIGGGGNNVFDSYLHSEHAGRGCCDNHEGVHVRNASNITIQGNVIAYNESNVRVDGSNHVTVDGNYLLNPLGPPDPRGQNVQVASSTDIVVTNNYAYSCVLAGSGLAGVACPAQAPDGSSYLFSENQEDSINFYHTTAFTARNNYVVGGHSGSGCGIIFDEQANQGQMIGNRLSDTGQCGIGVSDGLAPVVNNNKILNVTPLPRAGNSALYVWKQYSAPCGPTEVSGNVADEVKPDGSHSGYWKGDGCDPVTLKGNVFAHAAYDELYPMKITNPPPLIPPIPKNCVTRSPYSTQSSAPKCNPRGMRNSVVN
jgi:Right handed beta helix region